MRSRIRSQTVARRALFCPHPRRSTSASSSGKDTGISIKPWVGVGDDGSGFRHLGGVKFQDLLVSLGRILVLGKVIDDVPVHDIVRVPKQVEISGDFESDVMGAHVGSASPKVLDPVVTKRLGGKAEVLVVFLVAELSVVGVDEPMEGEFHASFLQSLNGPGVPFERRRGDRQGWMNTVRVGQSQKSIQTIFDAIRGDAESLENRGESLGQIEWASRSKQELGQIHEFNNLHDPT